MFLVFDPLPVTELDKPQQRGVGIIAGQQNEIIEAQIIGSTVAYQNSAVPVHQVAPGSLDPVDRSIGGGTLDHVALAQHLNAIHPDTEQAQQQRKDQQQNQRTESGYSFHVSPPILPIHPRSGYTRGITRILSPPVIANTRIRLR